MFEEYTFEMDRCVIFFEGEFFDCVDPILEFEETDTHWRIHNGYDWYEYEKKPGFTVRFTTLGDDDVEDV